MQDRRPPADRWLLPFLCRQHERYPCGLADDHPVVRAGLAALLGLCRVSRWWASPLTAARPYGKCATAPECGSARPAHSSQDGFAATREITRAAPEVAVLVLTMFDDDDSVFAAMRAGARGYVVKGAEQEEIGRAIRAVASGEAIF